MATRSLAISDARDLVYGVAPKPVRCGFDLTIGGGLVFPEVNFTLPAIEVSAAGWPQIVEHYEQIASSVLERAVALRVPGIVLEFELLPAMTAHPEFGAELTGLLHRHLEQAHSRHGLRCALRVTPTDIRDQERPPLLRRGAPRESLRRSFELCIAAGADIVSIESVGGKEVHDSALMYGDLRGIVFALGVLAPCDTAWLWDQIGSLCAGGRAIPGGDSACGFANTAMQLAHQKMLPEVLAAVVRAMSAVRSLAAFEHGAVGPSKDCAYEGPILKAITGCPISMEGKSATCAHFSPVGNVAAAMCDLWSNESVQNVRLLSGNAPEAYTELLAYDCRLMNTASAHGQARMLRDWLVESDELLSPQAAVLTPSATWRIANAINRENSGFSRTVAAGQAAVCELRERCADGRLSLSPREGQWLDRIEKQLHDLPPSGEDLWCE
ncbi:MAG TPA: methyltransferase MtaB domain-containing protein, partial [Candidatus Sulfopaludibacter sp.]|nr:methyltransferase MtaB domain-containing protein [Candidatus Sulfopaludibacter sp.]